MSMKKLTRAYCRTLAKTITNEQLCEMLVRAANEISNWDAPSRANKMFSRGMHWNLFCNKFDVNKSYHNLVKYRLLEEFGEYVDDELKPPPTRPKQKVVTRTAPPDLSRFLK